ncbi:TerD-family protein [Streptomyces chrestomyceticus JCM 4735]|uniref:TerD-family protein n=1 Tax=Streptomyces chrestomyceticus JCM 4735 TaxID=1306181 RepID=A0A7U9KT91_9ACTN|nr:TerD family protein [Streptomyces chrestomyceticus]GCD34363.1 TerD-family protein [Streptomyces chrestomyceticus JCM 4735]
MSSLNKGIDKVEVTLKWDPSPAGASANDLDLIAATYTKDDPRGAPDYLVHFDSRSPDGTIILSRDSRTGLGFGTDEAMVLELNRLADTYARVVVGVAIQQRGGRKTFGEVANTAFRVNEGYDELAAGDFSETAGATAAVIAEFERDGSDEWRFLSTVRGFDTDPETFVTVMGD